MDLGYVLMYSKTNKGFLMWKKKKESNQEEKSKKNFFKLLKNLKALLLQGRILNRILISQPEEKKKNQWLIFR